MNWESVEEFYAGLLGVESPWEVEGIERDSQVREVHVRIVFAESEAACPVCGKASSIHDRATRKWRHLYTRLKHGEGPPLRVVRPSSGPTAKKVRMAGVFVS